MLSGLESMKHTRIDHTGGAIAIDIWYSFQYCRNSFVCGDKLDSPERRCDIVQRLWCIWYALLPFQCPSLCRSSVLACDRISRYPPEVYALHLGGARVERRTRVWSGMGVFLISRCTILAGLTDPSVCSIVACQITSCCAPADWWGSCLWSEW